MAGISALLHLEVLYMQAFGNKLIYFPKQK